jgi:FkbM family methyltransferase
MKYYCNCGDRFIKKKYYDTHLKICKKTVNITYSNKTVIQIGSHIGDSINDPIFQKINRTTNLILVEPVPYLFEKLKQNYIKKNIDNIIFINKAVSNQVGKIELNIPSPNNDFSKFPFWASQLSSVNQDHISKHIPDLITEKITVETTTIDDIIKQYNIKEIELLHTDTEGHDFEILNSFSFSIKPKFILFEHKHLDGVLTKPGTKYKKLCDKLESLGYVFKYKNSEDTMYELNDKIIDIILYNKRTMVDRRRLLHLKDWVLKFNNDDVSFVECGVAKGGCLAIMKYFSGNKNKIYGFDSFEGMPSLTKEDENHGNNWVGYNCSDGIENVYKTFELINNNLNNVFIIKGFFEDTFPSNIKNIENIAILRLDNDWYKSTKYCLNMLYNKVIKGGVILIDDYGTFKGCKKAVDEFRKENNIKDPILKVEQNSEWYWIK